MKTNGNPHCRIHRGAAYGFVLGGACKLLVVLMAGTRLGPVKLPYELITSVLYLGIGGTIFIRQGR